MIESQSHVMIAPKGGVRIFYHAGCEALRFPEELARGDLEAARYLAEGRVESEPGAAMPDQVSVFWPCSSASERL